MLLTNAGLDHPHTHHKQKNVSYLHIWFSISITMVWFWLMLIATTGPLAAQEGLGGYGTPICSIHERFHFGQEIFLACTQEGLFKATPDGWQWLPLPAGFGEIKVTANGSIYLYSNSTYQVHRSADGGITWELRGVIPLTSSTDPWGHVFPTSIPDMLFLGVEDLPFTPDVRGVYKSVDGGSTWTRVLSVGNGQWVDFSPNFAADGVAFAAFDDYRTSLGIYKTTNWGETWFPVNTGLYIGGPIFWGHAWVAVSPEFSQDQTVFTSDGSGFYRTINGGTTWDKLSDIPSSYPLVFSPYYGKDHTLLRAELSLGLGLSQDAGLTWQALYDDANEETGYVYIAGMRRSGAFDIPTIVAPAPGPTSTASLRTKLMLSGVSQDDVEFWMVHRTDHFGDAFLYRSQDHGTTWDPIPILPQITVTQQTLPVTAKSGRPLTYTLRVTNTGTVLLHTTITATLPTPLLTGTLLLDSAFLPRRTLTWTPVITAPYGVWTQTLPLQVAADYTGPLTTSVHVSSLEGATSSDTKILIVYPHHMYLPLIVRECVFDG